MIEEYKNILANKFMRDTNYIIIKDTDDLEELERQWELFNATLTTRQQRLSDDRSVQIWNMTNQEHYEALKAELLDNLKNTLEIDDNEEPNSIEYEPEDDEEVKDDDTTNLVNMSFDDFEIPDDDNEISEPVKEESEIPTDGKEYIENEKYALGLKKKYIFDSKDDEADQFEIDTNINIIGRIKGETPEEKLSNLDKAFINWNSQSQDHRKKSDDKCREIYGVSNVERYNSIKSTLLDNITPQLDFGSNSSEQHLGEFVSEVYKNMQVVNEQESNSKLQHRRLNDTPYFTPSELIDMGVHGNHNYYYKDADNDGLITNIRIPTWFDSYKDMCMDHIFEDYTKDWIDTLDYLYSDFEEIKESGNEGKILARKQSILDLGWNPEIPFTRHNRQLASKRVSKLLDKSSPMNLFINLDKEVPDEAITDEPVTENASKDTHQPIYMVFVQGKAPIVSTAIKKVTNSPFSHAGISFDSKLDTVHTYNMVPKPGVVKETLSGYKDNIITVMAFFAPTDIYNTMKDTVMDYYINAKKTVYDFGIIFNKLINKNARVVNDKYHQICSTFVDTVLKSGKVTLDKDANVPSPAELYNATKSMPNKIIEVYSGPADKYDSAKIDKKMNKLLEKGTKAINEGIHDIMNGTNPFSTKTFYHISFDDNLDDKILKPRIPSWITKQMKDNPNFIKELEKLKDPGSTEGYGFEEYKTPRVCLSNSIEGCLNAIINEKGRMHLAGKTLYVYIPEKPISEYKTKTNKQILKDGDVFDANATNEMWILEPVKMKYVGSIVVDKITGEHIKKHVNNKNKTNIKYDYKWHWFHKVKYRYNPEKNKFVTESTLNEGISDLDSAESNDIYHNIEDWESGKSNVLWVTGLSGSGKSTISKEISAKYNDVEYVELDLIQAGKIKQWDDNDKRLNGLLKDFVDYKGGFDNIFPLYTEKARKGELNFGDMMDKSCADQFNELFEYIITYTKKNSNRRFVIEGVQIAMCTSNKMIEKISKYPVIIKMNGPLKTEFRREKRSIKSHIDQDMDFITTFKHVCHHIQTWVKNGFFLNNWKELNYFRTHIGESASVLNEVKQFPVEFDQDGNLIIYKARIGSIAYGDEIDDSVKLLESYRNTNNIEGMKYELAKLWFINDSIEKKLKKKLTNDQYKELIDHRATCLNVFKLNLEYVMKAEKGFNFSDYYNSTPFSDNSIKITANTLKYSMKAIANMI